MLSNEALKALKDYCRESDIQFNENDYIEGDKDFIKSYYNIIGDLAEYEITDLLFQKYEVAYHLRNGNIVSKKIWQTKGDRLYYPQQLKKQKGKNIMNTNNNMDLIQKAYDQMISFKSISENDRLEIDQNKDDIIRIFQEENIGYYETYEILQMANEMFDIACNLDLIS